jgi:hypothetical protein
MPRSLLVRYGGLSIAGAVALTTVVLAPAASAAAYDGQEAHTTSFNGGGGTCSASNPGSTSAPVALTSGGAPVNFSTSGTSTVTDSGDPGDITNLSSTISGAVSATELGGGLRTFDLSATTSLSVNPVQGAATDCDSSASTAVQATAPSLTIATSALLVLDTKLRGGQFQLQLIKTSGQLGTVQVTAGSNDRDHRVLTVPAGTYSMQVVAGDALAAPVAAGDATSRTSTISAHISIEPFGSATRDPGGPGAAYLKLPGSLNCAGHSMTADFTKAAGKKPKAGQKPTIRKAKFMVNGTKVKTVRKPNKKTSVTLGGLDDTDEVEVEVEVALKDGRKVTVTRSYHRCS